MSRADDADDFEWTPRGEPGDGRGWNLPDGKECAERFLPPAEQRGPRGGPHPPAVLAYVREAYAAGDHDLLDGGVPAHEAAEHFDISPSAARSALNELADDGVVVKVDGVAPDEPYWPRKSYIPAEMFDGRHPDEVSVARRPGSKGVTPTG